MDRRFAVSLGLILFAAFRVQAAFGVKPDGSLDQGALREAYTEGDFDKVRNALESARKEADEKATREDRIFTDKYLGVIYAADTVTTPKAESHFNMLIQLSPQIELADMFVSIRVQNIFDRVKGDFERNRDYKNRFDAFGSPKTGSPAKPAKSGKQPAIQEKGSSHLWLWIGAAVATVGIGAGYYFLFHQQSPPVKDNVVIVGGN